MNKISFPPGFQSRKIQPVELPNPSAFRELRPAILGTPPVPVSARRFERKRVLIGLAVAAAFHLILGIGWWLTPPLRLKAGIDPKRWVQVVSLPKEKSSTARAAPRQPAPVPVQSLQPSPPRP